YKRENTWNIFFVITGTYSGCCFKRISGPLETKCNCWSLFLSYKSHECGVNQGGCCLTAWRSWLRSFLQTIIAQFKVGAINFKTTDCLKNGTIILTVVYNTNSDQHFYETHSMSKDAVIFNMSLICIVTHVHWLLYTENILIPNSV
uniref:Uncharacterized protein n=1 Tax=Gasterosteus aculeatus TaxID=69293 RepID=G3P897_GASAC